MAKSQFKQESSILTASQLTDKWFTECDEFEKCQKSIFSTDLQLRKMKMDWGASGFGT
jgi:hypothetical protein